MTLRACFARAIADFRERYTFIRRVVEHLGCFNLAGDQRKEGLGFDGLVWSCASPHRHQSPDVFALLASAIDGCWVESRHPGGWDSVLASRYRYLENLKFDASLAPWTIATVGQEGPTR